MEFGYYTTKGLVRKNNEDCGAFVVKNDYEFMAIVCDGMGGHQGGGIASQKLVSLVASEYKMTASFLNVPFSFVKG